MSNKALAYLLIALVVVLAGGVALWVLTGSKPAPGSAGNDQLQSAQQSQTQPDQASDNNQQSGLSQTLGASTTPASTSSPATSGTCQRDFNQNILKTAKVNIKNRQVEIDVANFGKLTVELYDQDAPKTVENFLRLANSGYYDCLTFHRVSKGFVIQGGDPTGTGSGGDSAFGGEFADELDPNTPSYKAGYQKGVLAMANRGPNTNTSQFFIMLADVPLDHNYTIFGKVISGQDVVDKIGQVDITPNPALGPTDGAPKVPVVLQKVKIIK